MSRNNPSDLHERAQVDDIHGGPPAKWPRRKRDRPRPPRTQRRRGAARSRSGRSASLGVVHLRKQIAQTDNGRRVTQAIPQFVNAGRSDPQDGWYRSKRGRRWHWIEDGETSCGAEILRAGGRRTVIDTSARPVCSKCAA